MVSEGPNRSNITIQKKNPTNLRTFIHLRFVYRRLPFPKGIQMDPTKSTALVAAAATAASAASVVVGGFLKQGHERDCRSNGGSGCGGLILARRFFKSAGARGMLAVRLASDAAAAAVASLMVSPFVSIVDRAIIQSASGTAGIKASVMQGLRVMVTKPALFSARPDFICTFSLYAATCESF